MVLNDNDSVNENDREAAVGNLIIIIIIIVLMTLFQKYSKIPNEYK